MSSVAFAPEGDILAAVFSAEAKDDYVVIFDVNTCEEKRSIPVKDCKNQLNAIEFSIDGRMLALGRTNGD